jgi:hypothetical protein
MFVLEPRGLTIDEVNPATCDAFEDKCRPLFQVAGWLVFCSLDLFNNLF